jgi:hypothetical protein
VAVGWNEYPVPTVAVVGGVPLIVSGTAAAVTVTLALADLVVSSTDTAVTETVDGDGAVAGAVYRPAVEIVPTVELPPVTPFTCQVTDPFTPFVTVALNCWLPEPAVTLAMDGEIETATGAVIVTDAGADRVGSATDTALTVTVAGDGTLAGAL